MSKRILEYIGSKNSFSDFYRGRGVTNDLMKNHGYSIIPINEDFDWHDLSLGDIGYFQNPCTHEAMYLIQKCKAIGKPVIVDYDFDYLNVPKYHPMFHAYKNIYMTIYGIVSIADMTLCASEAIKESLESYTEHIMVIPDGFNDTMLGKDSFLPFNKESKKVLWCGTPADADDLYNVKDQLITLINEHTDYKFIFFGYDPVFIRRQVKDNYLYCPPVDILTYHNSLQALAPKVRLHFSDEAVQQDRNSIESDYEGSYFIMDYSTNEEFNPSLSESFKKIHEHKLGVDFLSELNKERAGLIETLTSR